MRAIFRRPATGALRALMLQRLRDRLAQEAERRLDALPVRSEGEEKLTDTLDGRA